MGKVNFKYTMVDEFDGVWDGEISVETTEEDVAAFKAVMAAYEEEKRGEMSLDLFMYLEDHFDSSLYDTLICGIYDDWREQVVEDGLGQFGLEIFNLDENDWDEMEEMSEEELRMKAYEEMEFPSASIESISISS